MSTVGCWLSVAAGQKRHAALVRGIAKPGYMPSHKGCAHSK